MTEITAQFSPSYITPAAEKLILHWGEMGSRWGVNRTVAQIHALLYLAPRPLHAGEIAETLKIARSNVSSSLRELQAWGITRTTHRLVVPPPGWPFWPQPG